MSQWTPLLFVDSLCFQKTVTCCDQSSSSQKAPSKVAEAEENETETAFAESCVNELDRLGLETLEHQCVGPLLILKKQFFDIFQRSLTENL